MGGARGKSWKPVHLGREDPLGLERRLSSGTLDGAASFHCTERRSLCSSKASQRRGAGPGPRVLAGRPSRGRRGRGVCPGCDPLGNALRPVLLGGSPTLSPLGFSKESSRGCPGVGAGPAVTSPGGPSPKSSLSLKTCRAACQQGRSCHRGVSPRGVASEDTSSVLFQPPRSSRHGDTGAS